MATTADFKNGIFFLFNDHPCQLVYFQHVKPG
ncbi:MAG: elongation factor P, partial [Bacteroidales bacterium]|nr:elongation factor P [Bacteroidales bacterium]